MRALVIVVALQCAACELIGNLDLRSVAESTDALCSDGVDNDADGLTDCQDWKCLGSPVCCNMPVIVLADDFNDTACAAASCDAPDPSCQADATRWQSWGLPLPVECQGALTPHKAEGCYDVGVLSLQALPLHPGLTIVAHLEGGLESGGRLTVGVTLQSQAAGGVTACSPVVPPTAVMSLREAPTAAGYKIIATFDRMDLSAAPEITDDLPHEVRLSVGDDRRAHYAVDGVEFAQSPAAQPFPDSAPSSYLMISGRGVRARVSDISVVDGTQCEAPDAWQPEDPPIALDAQKLLHAWDGSAVYAPTVTELSNGDVQMYYAGCNETTAGVCSSPVGIGRASSTTNQPFVRDLPNPRLPTRRRVALDFGLVRPVVDGAARNGFITSNGTAADTALVIERATDDDVNGITELEPLLRPGAAGSWDDADVCCASAVSRGGRTLLWYAGRSVADPTWRVGLAVSGDGVTYTKVAGSPVLVGGSSSDAFDGHGAGDPEVTFDESRQLYRMWYTATAFLGIASIGYAVSTDGVHWSKYPGNPVLTLDAAGLDSIDSPAVVVEQGRSRMWTSGHEPGGAGDKIYAFTNRGRPPAR
ncbi:MAG: hypothetical protein JWM53_4277 [bacterium]|nr:hypothetical protein [bacterium]